jgi:hypothetical protein
MAKPFYFLSCDAVNAKVYRHDGFSAEILWTANSAPVEYGLAYYYTGIILGRDNKFYRYSCDAAGIPYTFLDSFSSPSTNLTDVAWYESNAYSNDADSGKIYKHLGFTATISDSFSHPAAEPTGLEIDNNVYSGAWDSEKIYKHSGFSATISDSFSSPSNGLMGVGFDGNNIYSCDYYSVKVYKHSGFSSTISESISVPNAPWGVCAYYAPDRNPSVNNSITITENISLLRSPSVDVSDQISSLDFFLTDSLFFLLAIENIDIQDVQDVSVPQINVSESISIAEVIIWSGLITITHLVMAQEFIYCEERKQDVRRTLLDVKDVIFVDEVVTMDRKQYGLKIFNPRDSSIYSLVTPEVSTIISAGRITMPDSLNGDGTYGIDIPLPDLGDVPKENIGVMIFPVEFTFAITNILINLDPYFQNVPYMSSAENYYEHSKANGQMSAWAAGNLTDGNPNTFDHVAGMFPVSFWDIMGGTTFTKVRLFSAMCYLCYDTSASAFKKVFSIGNKGVSVIDYAIILKRFNPQPKYIEIGCDNLTVLENIGLSIV